MPIPDPTGLAASPLVDWEGLARMLVLALVAGPATVLAFSLGLVCLDRYRARAPGGGPGATVSLTLAAAAFLVCVGALALGLVTLVVRR